MVLFLSAIIENRIFPKWANVDCQGLRCKSIRHTNNQFTKSFYRINLSTALVSRSFQPPFWDQRGTPK